MMKHYGNYDFWEERYRLKNEAFDWYLRIADIEEHLINFIKPNYSYLDVGCGTSRVYEYLFEKGCQNVVCVDFCYDMIARQIENLNPNYLEKVKFLCMDVRKMELDEETFNVVIDKGTLDSILCANTSMVHISRYLDEVDKVLEKGGAYILISFGAPDIREHYLKREKWQHKVIEIPMLDFSPPKPEQPKNQKPKKRRRRKKVEPEKRVFYLYICQKGVIQEVKEDMEENDVDGDENEE